MDQRLEGEFWAPVLAETWGSPCGLVVATLVARTVQCLCITLASPFYRFLARYSGERNTVKRVSYQHTFDECSWTDYFCRFGLWFLHISLFSVALRTIA